MAHLAPASDSSEKALWVVDIIPTPSLTSKEPFCTCAIGEVSLTSQVAQMVKRLPAMREARVQFLGWEDHLEKEIATHSSILAWRISWTGELSRLQFTGLQRLGHN